MTKVKGGGYESQIAAEAERKPSTAGERKLRVAGHVQTLGNIIGFRRIF